MIAQHIEIVSKGSATEILVDGHKLNGVKKFEISQVPGELPIIKLDLAGVKVSVNTMARIYDFSSNEGMKIFWDGETPESISPNNLNDDKYFPQE